jgi:hypothetical protein
MALFNFKLFSLPQSLLLNNKQLVRHLNWYQLTEGYFWFEVGEQCLLKYSENTPVMHPRLDDSLPYVDYYLAQVYQDLDDLLGYILNPIPIDIFQRIATRPAMLDFLDKQEMWLANAPSEEVQEGVWDKYMLASFIGHRKLDLGYIRAQHIWFLGLKDQVIIRWGQNQTLNTIANVWYSPCGEYRIHLKDFIGEVIDFLDRLHRQMTIKVDQACQLFPISGVELDLELLKKEHLQHRLPEFKEIQNRVRSRISNSENWEAIRNAIKSIDENKY